MHPRSCAALAFTLLTLTACGDGGPPTVGQPTSFANACDKANDGHRVAVQGVMRLPDTIRISRPARGGQSSEIVVVRLFETPAFKGTPIGVDIGFGTEPNTMDQIPSGAEGYTDADLKVHIAGGQTVTYGQAVKVSGTVYFPTALADVEFPCGLSNPLIELATG